MTRQLVQRSGYLEEFARFWQDQPHCRKIWFSLYTPQIGEESAEKLRPEDRREVVGDAAGAARALPQDRDAKGHDRGLREAAGIARGVHLRARRRESVSADLQTRITPCQFGGRPDCANCGCIASAGLGAVGRYQLAGPLRVDHVFNASLAIGSAVRSVRQRLSPSALCRAAAGTVRRDLSASHSTMRRRVLLLVCLLSLPASLWAAVEITLPNATDSLKFAVIGDSGTGAGRQYQLAAQFAAAYKLYPFSFVLMLGDNIYGRETAKDFFRKFELPYKALLDAGVPFYAALGNHDEPTIQINYKPFNMDGKRYYSVPQGRRGVLRDRQHLHVDRAGALGRKGAVRVERAVEDRLHAPPDLLVGQAPRVRGRAARVHRAAVHQVRRQRRARGTRALLRAAEAAKRHRVLHLRRGRQAALGQHPTRPVLRGRVRHRLELHAVRADRRRPALPGDLAPGQRPWTKASSSARSCPEPHP